MKNNQTMSEERVWRRVRGEESQSQPDLGLPGLIAGEMGAAAVYLALSKRSAGQDGEVLRKMAREEQAHEACLRGICRMMTGECPVVKVSAPVQEPLAVTLRRCYAGEMKSLAQYESRSYDREYGHVFARMAQQEREHCRLLLEIIGRQK